MPMTIFACKRSSGGQRLTRCRCGNKTTVQCSFKLRGAKAGQQCETHICGKCSRRGQCLPHAQFTEKEKA